MNDKDSIRNETIPILNDENCSMIKTSFCGEYPYLANKVSTRYFLIMDGEAEFDIDGKKSILKQKDIIMIPPNTKYKFRGNFETTIIDMPAFRQENEVIVDE